MIGRLVGKIHDIEAELSIEHLEHDVDECDLDKIITVLTYRLDTLMRMANKKMRHQGGID